MRRSGGFGRIPGVYSQDPSTPAAQFTVPFLRTLVGIPLSFLMAGLGATWFIWLIPPDSALFITGFVLACGITAAGWLGLLARAEQTQATDDDAVRLHINRQVAAFLACVGMAIIIVVLGKLDKSWWGLPARTWRTVVQNVGLYTAQFVISAALVLGGVFGIYWYAKETVTPHELVGEHYIEQLKLDWEKEQYYDQRTWVYEKAEMQELIQELKHDLIAANASPLVNAAKVSTHQRQPLLWQLTVTQLLLAGEITIGHTQNSWCPGGKTIHTLPLTSQPVNDALVRWIYRAMRKAMVGDLPVMLSRSNKTFFAPGVPTMLAVGAIKSVPVWPGFGNST